MQQQTFTPGNEPEHHPKVKFSFLYIAAAVLLLISLYLIFGSKSEQNGTLPKGESTEPIGPISCRKVAIRPSFQMYSQKKA